MRISIVSLAVAGGMSLACATTPKPPLFTVDEAKLKDQVTASLASDEDLDARGIVVDVENRTVRLTGTVADEEQRLLATSLVLGTRGVRAVVNRLDLAPPSVVAEGIGD